MSVDEFIRRWGFVAFSRASMPGYARATWAEQGQSLRDGHHSQAATAELALRMLDVYLRSKGMVPAEVTTT